MYAKYAGLEVVELAELQDRCREREGTMATATQKREQSRQTAAGNGFPTLHRFTVTQYERMAQAGVLRGMDHVELLDGCIVDNVDRMMQNPPHNAGIDYAHAAIAPLLSAEWFVREQKAIRLATSEPEPDIAVVRSPRSRYARLHPVAADIGFLVEVSDSSLTIDRDTKGPLYARARIPVYWIVNLAERKVELYTVPRAGKTAGYRQRQDYGSDGAVPVVLEGREIGQIRVRDLLP